MAKPENKHRSTVPDLQLTPAISYRLSPATVNWSGEYQDPKQRTGRINHTEALELGLERRIIDSELDF